MDEDEKVCQLPGCEEIFTRPSWCGRPQFAKQKYHNRACAEKAKINRDRGGSIVVAPAPIFVPRYNSEGRWRPNAPGWPDIPS